MSLATFGKRGGEEGVILPIVEYDDLDLGGAEEAGAVGGDEGDEEGEGYREETNRPGWDNGPERGWGAEHGWGHDAPTFGWDTRRTRMAGPVVQAIVDGELEFQ